MRVEGALLSPRPGQDKEDSREGERGEEGEGKGVQAKGRNTVLLSISRSC